MIRKGFIQNNKMGKILFFLICPFLLYLPVINKYFVSDDFTVLSRICLDHIILIKGFFRPLSDLTILMNYSVGGFNPLIFNSFNVLLHGVNSLLLYRLCRKIRVSAESLASKQFAFITSMLFMTYPFHNEGIVWLLGRGASMSCGFALAGMLAMLSRIKLSKKILLTCSCYFIGLLAYESIIFFPIIILILAWITGTDGKEKAKWAYSLLLTLAIHLIMRVLISGSITGTYGESFLNAVPTNYLLNIAKTAGRLILPPTGDLHWLIFAYTAILIVGVVLSTLLIYQNSNNPVKKLLKGIFFCLLVACLTPVFSGISTVTSESDRMLYFPSVFLCMILAMLLTFYIENSFKRLLICSLILGYQVFFLEKNNFNWVLAGKTTQSLIEILKNRTSGKTYLMDVPEEYKGAYIFRQGLNYALHINSLDSSKVIVVNYLTREQVGLPPLSTIARPLPLFDKEDEVIFWNRMLFVRLANNPENSRHRISLYK